MVDRYRFISQVYKNDERWGEVTDSVDMVALDDYRKLEAKLKALEHDKIDTHRAHGLMQKAQLLELYYKAQDVSDQYRHSRTNVTAVDVDRVRGEFFIAVCEWARSLGAKLPEVKGG